MLQRKSKKNEDHDDNPHQQQVRDKTITAKQCADMVKPGDWINAAVRCGFASHHELCASVSVTVPAIE